jgi:hypothetical protein
MVLNFRPYFPSETHPDILGRPFPNTLYNEVNQDIIFYVVNDVTESLLGLKTYVELKIISRNEPQNFKETNLVPVHQVERSENKEYQNIVQTFGEVFSGIGYWSY